MANYIGHFLITSRSGAGKSTVCRELQRRGLPALDGDTVAGLARWVDTAAGQPVRLAYGTGDIDRSKYHWDWDPAVLQKLLGSHDQLLLCGSADNQLGYHRMFDQVFVLTLPPEVQRQRLLNRTDHDYGKHPAMQAKIIAEQAAFVAAATQQSAIPVDANRPVMDVVDDIVQQLRGFSDGC